MASERQAIEIVRYFALDRADLSHLLSQAGERTGFYFDGYPDSPLFPATKVLVILAVKVFGDVWCGWSEDPDRESTIALRAVLEMMCELDRSIGYFWFINADKAISGPLEFLGRSARHCSRMA